MTDNEIIKYMQCVIGNEVSCSECTYQKVLPFPSCRMMCAKNALDLINRQKAENESLKVDLAKCSIRLDNLYKTADEIKSEAIKEFAERFAKELSEFDMSSVGLPDYDRGYKDCMTAIEDTIDSLVKRTILSRKGVKL